MSVNINLILCIVWDQIHTLVDVVAAKTMFWNEEVKRLQLSAFLVYAT